MNTFQNGNLCEITYDAVRVAMKGEPFTMSVTNRDEVAAIVAAANQGIDSHLEACNCPERGDTYGDGERKVGELVVCRSMDCVVSVESLPTLLRRLFELEHEDTDVEDAGRSLADSILDVLGFDDCGRWHERDT